MRFGSFQTEKNRTNGYPSNLPEYREAIARAKLVKSATRRGMMFGLFPPFAHLGVPEIVRTTSWSFSCAARTASSMSSKLYAGSKELAGLDGRVFADDVPLDEEPHDRRVRLRRTLDPRLPIADPAEARVVVEADPHALGGHRSRRGEGGEHGQNDDEADDTSHEVSQEVGGDEGGLKTWPP